MLRITGKNKIYFVGKVDELIEALEDLSSKHVTLEEAINDILKSQ